MLSTRLINKNEDNSTSSARNILPTGYNDRNALPGGYNDSRGYHKTSYKGESSSFDCKRIWALLLYFGTFLLIIFCLWDLISPVNNSSNSLVDKTKGNDNKAGNVQNILGENLRTVPIKLTAEENVEENIKTRNQELDSKPKKIREQGPDSLGCYHDIQETDLNRHIVPPPKGPVKLVCCQSSKGEGYPVKSILLHIYYQLIQSLYVVYPLFPTSTPHMHPFLYVT